MTKDELKTLWQLLEHYRLRHATAHTTIDALSIQAHLLKCTGDDE